MTDKNTVLSADDTRDVIFDSTFKGSLPKSVDMRSLNRDVEEQGDQGSCVAHALTNCVEMMSVRLGMFENLSRQFSYYTARESSGDLGKEGTTPRDALKMAKKVGICLEKEWTYANGNEEKKPSPNCYASAAFRRVTRYEHVAIFRSSPESTIFAAKSALAKGLPILIASAIGHSLQRVSGQLATHKKQYLGLQGKMTAHPDFDCYHAMLVVGYDDVLGGFIVENSWGKDWGHKGYFLMPYSFVADWHEAWVVTEFRGVSTIAATPPGPVPVAEQTEAAPTTIFTVLSSIFGALFAKKKI